MLLNFFSFFGSFVGGLHRWISHKASNTSGDPKRIDRIRAASFSCNHGETSMNSNRITKAPADNQGKDNIGTPAIETPKIDQGAIQHPIEGGIEQDCKSGIQNQARNGAIEERAIKQARSARIDQEIAQKIIGDGIKDAIQNQAHNSAIEEPAIKQARSARIDQEIAQKIIGDGIKDAIQNQARNGLPADMGEQATASEEDDIRRREIRELLAMWGSPSP